MSSPNGVLAQIASLPGLPHEQLKALWREYFGVEPPAYRRGFLVRGLAHRIQELAYGGLSAPYQARLEALIEDDDPPARRGRKPGRKVPRADRLLIGTRLMREWKGVAHEVTVVDGGFEYQGRLYRSLSAIARAITGTRWNGPLFFGLRADNSKGGGE